MRYLAIILRIFSQNIHYMVIFTESWKYEILSHNFENIRQNKKSIMKTVENDIKKVSTGYQSVNQSTNENFLDHQRGSVALADISKKTATR